MPKKKRQETQTEQSERFQNAVREMVAAGELNPTEADNAVSSLLAGGGVGQSARRAKDQAASYLE